MANDVTDDMVEIAWTAIVGNDIAKTCFNASIIRADLKTGLAAALAATPAVGGEDLTNSFNALLLIEHGLDEPLAKRIADQWRQKCAELAEWKQAAGVEASLRREAHAALAALKDDLRSAWDAASPPEQPAVSDKET